MGLFSSGKSNTKKLDWTKIETIEELERAIDTSHDHPAVFYKHSTRCSISSMALNRLESEWEEGVHATLYFIDLIKNRAVSNALAEKVNVYHQSPQVIVIKESKSIYDASHSAISANEIIEKIN